MRLLAIDPGNEQSACVLYDTELRQPVEWEKLPNRDVLCTIWAADADELCIEMIASYGMPVGAEVFETCVWIGRFFQEWMHSEYAGKRNPKLVYRREVKLHLCDSARAKDANVRRALIDRYGGREKAIGRKAAPGPLYGLTGDCWSALAVAVTVADQSVRVAA